LISIDGSATPRYVFVVVANGVVIFADSNIVIAGVFMVFMDLVICYIDQFMRRRRNLHNRFARHIGIGIGKGDSERRRRRLHRRTWKGSVTGSVSVDGGGGGGRRVRAVPFSHSTGLALYVRAPCGSQQIYSGVPHRGGQTVIKAPGKYSALYRV